MTGYIVLPHQWISYRLNFLISKLKTLDKIMWKAHPHLDMLILWASGCDSAVSESFC